MKINQLLWLAILVTCFAGSYGQRCEPTCFGHTVGELVANPRNCTQFYECMPGNIPSDAPFDCNPGMIFDPAPQACVPGTSCVHACPPCHLTCTAADDHVADPTDCSKYYVCDINGPGAAQFCPVDRPHFDGSSCVNDVSVCCNPSCNPFCEEAAVLQVPDPENCTVYYRCINSIPQNPQICPTSTPYFDYSIGHCSSSPAKCAWCSGPIIIDTTTTTPGSIITTTTPSIIECLNSLTCTAAGLFPACPYCDPKYFQCGAAGQQGILQQCTDNLVFNTVPSYPYCILPTNCPYTPPQ